MIYILEHNPVLQTRVATGAYGYPDTQLISYAEMANAATYVAEGLSSAAMERGVDPIPCIADGDTGYVCTHIQSQRKYFLNQKGSFTYIVNPYTQFSYYYSCSCNLCM